MKLANLSLFAAASAMLAAPALAQDTQGPAPAADSDERQGPPAGPLPGVATGDIVFDDTWVTLGIGAGLVPSYTGSDDYIVFPLPLIVGRVGGIGISPNGPGFNLDLLSQTPARGAPQTSFSFGPSFRIRNDRESRIEDEVVEAAGELDLAVELGVNGGVTFPGVFMPQDRVAITGAVRWDVAGAHDGLVFEPGVSYFRPIGRGGSLQLAATAQITDDDFADYYFSVNPAQSAASGLPQFQADGGLNSLGLTAIGTIDLDGNALNGGWSIYGIGGYSRLVGDARNTPYTSIQGNPNQFIGGLGVGYTF